MAGANEYAEAVQSAAIAFRDPEIRVEHTALNAMGLPQTWTGNFAVVFKVLDQSGQRTWAAKCFTRDVAELQKRYRQIHRHLERNRRRLPFMVNFVFLPDELPIGQDWYPVLKMDWLDGLHLTEVIELCLTERDPAIGLRRLSEQWLLMARSLRGASVAHGDLHSENILFVPVVDPNSRELTYEPKLIDYDEMYVPELTSGPSDQVIHASYQHPQRTPELGYGPEMDRFSHLLIYTTLRCLANGGSDLWERHHENDRLLLGQYDLAAPQRSPVFRDLMRLRDPTVKYLVSRLRDAAEGPIDYVPILDDLVSETATPAPTEIRQQTSGQHSARLGRDGGGDATHAPDETAKETTADKDTGPMAMGPTPAAIRPPPLPRTNRFRQRHAKRSPADRIFSSGTAMFLMLILVLAGALYYDETEPPPIAAFPFDATQAKIHQVEWGRFLRVPAEIENSIGMKLVLIPPGEFDMGSPVEEQGRQIGERLHHVRVPQPFYIGVHEVTRSQWEVLMGSQPWSRVRGHRRHVQESSDSAVTGVTWKDANDFCKRLTARDGRKYRLPTEAEWEYACRAGTMGAYFFGDDASQLYEYAWIRHHGEVGKTYARPVGLKKPNGFGLYDILGNVEEWCSDWYQLDYVTASPVSDPPGLLTGSYRVSRGGSWGSQPEYCRSAHRSRRVPQSRYGSLGFRVVAVPPSLSNVTESQ